MDAASIKELVTLLQGGGPVAMLVAVWVAYRAGQTANKAVQSLADIREEVIKRGPVIEKMADNIEDIDERTRDMAARIKVAA